LVNGPTTRKSIPASLSTTAARIFTVRLPCPTRGSYSVALGSKLPFSREGGKRTRRHDWYSGHWTPSPAPPLFQCSSSCRGLIPGPGGRSGRHQKSSQLSRASPRRDHHPHRGARWHPPTRKSGQRIGPVGQPSADEIRQACLVSRRVLSQPRVGQRL